MFYKFAAIICKNILRLIYRVKVEGDNSIDQVKGCIIYANHTCYLDPVVMGSFIKRQLRFMAKAELFNSRLFRNLLLRLGAFPVRRGEADLGAVKTALSLLKNGEVLGIFPEGTRNKSGTFMGAEPGLSMIAIRARVPVIPVAILSNYRLFSSLRIIIGQPIYLEEYYNKKINMDQHKEISENLMRKVIDMLEETKIKLKNS